MTKLSQPRRTRIVSPSPVDPEVIQREQEAQQSLRERCRPLFERLRPTLKETHPNWFIAIDPDTEEYILDPTLRGLTEKISPSLQRKYNPDDFPAQRYRNLWSDMIVGTFGEDGGELFFEIQLVPTNGAPFAI
jgi:hypothetical protein